MTDMCQIFKFGCLKSSIKKPIQRKTSSSLVIYKNANLKIMKKINYLSPV